MAPTSCENPNCAQAAPEIPIKKTQKSRVCLIDCIASFSIPDKYIKTSFTTKKNSKKRAT
jgi:hypothetical protein